MTTTIEWTDETWNPVVGCAIASTGCDNCYAAKEAAGRLSGLPQYKGLAVRVNGVPQFTGEVRTLPERLDQPLRWKKPRRVFVNSMSDLFHPEVGTAFICSVFDVMSRAKQHTFQVLTKRPHRMARLSGGPLNRGWGDYPLPNVWLGTSVENQRYADLRIPHLLSTKAAVRFLSIEPSLGPVDLDRHLEALSSEDVALPCGIDWVIVGGESGPHARPMHPDWVRSIRDQCVAAGVPFFFKQWGEWSPMNAIYNEATHVIELDGRWHARAGEGLAPIADRGAVHVGRVGKKVAGRMLDGRTWDEYPA